MADEKESKAQEVEEKEGKALQRPGWGHAPSPFDEMERWMDRAFEDMVPRGWMRPFHWDRPLWGRLAAFEGRLPRVDIIDRENELVVHAEVPGVRKEDLDVSMTDDTVTIKGTTRKEEKEERGDYYRRETSRGEFSRTVSLPCGVDGSKAKATFKDGVMELVLPKLEQTKRRKITVE